MFNKKNSVLGLDIGFESLKLVELKQTSKGFELVGFIETPLTDKLLEKDRFRDKKAAAKYIKDACKKAKPNPITAKKIVAALPESFVFSKTIKLPKMAENDLANAVRTEASQYLPILIDETYIDYQPLIIHPDEPMVDVMFVATPKNLVDDFVELSRLAGFELFALETKPLAVGRAIIDSARDNNATAIIEIGTEISRIAIWENKSLRLVSSVQMGANQIKENFSLFNLLSKKSLTDDQIADISPVITPISDEIINAIQYHQKRDYKPKPITEILLCGKGTKFPSINKIFEKELNIKSTTINPKFRNSEIGSEFVTAVGLAMRKEE